MFLVVIIFLIYVTLATYIYMFKKAAHIEIAKEEDEIMHKLGELEETLCKLTDTKEDQFNDAEGYRQTIWLGLTEGNEIYKELNKELTKERDRTKIEGPKIQLFSSAHHIISFLKYLFAIKPKMQFKSLDKKFVIVIELYTDINVKNFLKEKDIEQIDILFDWLNFAGCKIPVIMYSENKLDRYLRMNLISNYWNVTCINTKKELSALVGYKSNERKVSDIHSNFKNLERQKSMERRPTHKVEHKNETSKQFKKNIMQNDKESLTVLSEQVDEE
jgi:hypothetical protein